MSQKPSDVHSAVRAHYGAIVQTANRLEETRASCCSGGSSSSSCCGDQPALYEAALLEGLPEQVTNISLGCGDPISIASLKPGETVVDLGSGGGIDCFLAGRQVGPTGHVIGVDMTPDMIAKANANKQRMGVTNVEFRQGQIEALPVDDNTVDVIISNCVINLAPDKRPVFSEAFRVLKPGGRVSVSDVVTEGARPENQPVDLESWAACVLGALDVNDYMGLMREAGFVDVTAVDKMSDAEANANDSNELRYYSARITGRKPA